MPDETLKLQEELSHEKDKNLRLLAEFDNYRKRTHKEIEDARVDGLLSALEPILNVFDNFSLASKATELLDDKDPLKKGIRLIFNEFNRALINLKIERIDVAGKDFDHNLHNAVVYEESNQVEKGKVIRQWNCGYKMGSRIIRPASVVVSSGLAEK